MAKLNCVVIDDEQAGRQIIESFIAGTDHLNLLGSFSGASKASEFLANAEIDLMFLDIQMPRMSGIDFLRSLSKPPATIMVTAHSEYAIQGYELDVVDYLLKPVSKDRFLKACMKAKEHLAMRKERAAETHQPAHFFVKCNNQYEKVKLDDLLFVEAANNYVMLQTRDRNLITYLTLKGISDFLPEERFIRVHKSFIVALDKIDSIDSDKVTIQAREVPISKALRKNVMDLVLSKNTVRR